MGFILIDVYSYATLSKIGIRIKEICNGRKRVHAVIVPHELSVPLDVGIVYEICNVDNAARSVLPVLTVRLHILVAIILGIARLISTQRGRLCRGSGRSRPQGIH
jgi:hypothetical protein